MLFILIALVLVLAIAFYQVVQGLYSSLIMAILTVLAAAAAFNYYEPLAQGMLYERQPAHGDAAALIALFVLPLLGLRLLFDRFLGANVVLGVWADRIGGGLLGIIAGIVLVGTLTVAAQMLPVGGSIMGFTPYGDSLQRKDALFPFHPDEFTVGMVKRLSAGSGKSDQPFEFIHDDLLLELFCARNTAGHGGRVDAQSDALDVPVKAGSETRENRPLEMYEPPADRMSRQQPAWMQNLPKNPLLKGDEPTRTVIVRVRVDELTRENDDPENPARSWWLLPATHFRLVTTKGRGFYPVAYLIYAYEGPARLLRDGKRLEEVYIELKQSEPGTKEPALREGWNAVPAPAGEDGPQIGKLIAGRKWENGPSALVVDWVYVIPAGSEQEAAGGEAGPQGEQPAYLAFRRVAKAPIGEAINGMPPLFDEKGDMLPLQIVKDKHEIYHSPKGARPADEKADENVGPLSKILPGLGSGRTTPPAPAPGPAVPPAPGPAIPPAPGPATPPAPGPATTAPGTPAPSSAPARA